MAVTEVTGFAVRPFSALSGGERARVAPARVRAQRAPLLMLVEPTAALDLRHQELVLRVCRERARAGDAVVVVLHDLGPWSPGSPAAPPSPRCARGSVRGPGGDPARRADRGGQAAGGGVFNFQPAPTILQVTVWPLYLIPTLALFLAPVGFASGKGKVKIPDEQGSRGSEPTKAS